MPIQELHVGIRLTDVWGLKASTDLYAAVDDTQTIGQMITDAQAALLDVDPITDAQITAAEIRLTVPVTITGLKTAATGNQKVDMVGLFGFSVSGTKKHYAVPIPAISSATTVLIGDRIVTGTGTPANAFAKKMLATNGSAIKSWDNNTNQALIAGAYALIGDRSRRKQLGASSREPLVTF